MNLERIFQDKTAFFIVVSPNETYLLSVGRKSLKLIDLETKATLRVVLISNICEVVFSPQEQWVIATNTSGKIYIFSLPLLERVDCFSSNVPDVGGLVFIDDTTFFYPFNAQEMSTCHEFLSYNCKTKQRNHLFEKDRFFYYGHGAIFAQDRIILLGDKVYDDCKTRNLELIHSDYPYHKFSSEIIQNYSSINSAYNPQKDWIAVDIYDKLQKKVVVDVLDETRKRIHRISAEKTVEGICWLSDGNYLLIISNCKCRLYDGNTFQEIPEFFSDLNFVCSVVAKGAYASILYDNRRLGGCDLYKISDSAGELSIN